ncbi:transcriptional regulator, XRE family [Ammonifex degensii KC4]|uniref:Transcriptional regulator, XRE family n=1 Tax=Ammonifex degensii (strain DSM 10501 / KC4) TaxID=429009 RepID=C9RA88_AMMDK|nr:helix-turn-helix domain-containing protein [Ammonifex degensii]ACX51197.1 transcriptional regulator, XRE family [Ammonifex degensii KC4]
MKLTRLKLLRLRRGLTCAEVARKLGYQRTYLSAIENGSVRAGEALRKTLAHFFACGEHELFDESGYARPE